MYPSVIRNLFGENVLPIHDEKNMRDLMLNFVLYDDQFEYGTQIPQIFLRYAVTISTGLLLHDVHYILDAFS